MAEFADSLRRMIFVNLNGPVTDETGLKGKWNFDVRWSLPIIAPAGGINHISVMEAVDKQLGLKLEQKDKPGRVLVVERVERTPSPNPRSVAEAFPPVEAPKEFEVADVKLSGGDFRNSRLQMQPGGRFISQGMPLRFLMSLAFATEIFGNVNEQITGIPSFADSLRLDIQAKVPTEAVTGPGLDQQTVAPMLRNLLADRLKMTYHTEDRQVTTYKLVATKPKLKKADPDSRIFCKNENAPNAPPASRTLTCQNATMAMLAERLRGIAPTLAWPVTDATGLEGGWDFTFTFSQLASLPGGVGRGGGEPNPAGADVPVAADPTGGYSVFEAIEKQLGLKLESQKRPMPVIVIDHIENKPTDN
jgi:uncharacterized protein (TIGR03435 family)